MLLIDVNRSAIRQDEQRLEGSVARGRIVQPG